MSEGAEGTRNADAAAAAAGNSAGGLLRAAREAQGLHIAALAASIKVTPRKLDALENNRWDELPDATFIRALAQTVCRTLKIDARPVLDLLPAAGRGGLENVAGTLNTPFRERGSSADPGLMGAPVRPMLLGGALLLVAALVVFFAPAAWWPQWAEDSVAVGPAAVFPPPDAALAASQPLAGAPGDGPAEAPAQTTAAAASASTQAADATGQPATVPAFPAMALAATVPAALPTAGSVPVAAAASAQVGVAPPSAEAILIKANQASWVEARDAQGRVLLSRLVAAGEDLAIDGPKPVRLVIGNAVGVELRFRQQPVDLQPLTRDNVARLQLP